LTRSKVLFAPSSVGREKGSPMALNYHFIISEGPSREKGSRRGFLQFVQSLPHLPGIPRMGRLGQPAQPSPTGAVGNSTRGGRVGGRRRGVVQRVPGEVQGDPGIEDQVLDVESLAAEALSRGVDVLIDEPRVRWIRADAERADGE